MVIARVAGEPDELDLGTTPALPSWDGAIVADSRADSRWAATYRSIEVDDAEVHETESGLAVFADAEKKYSARLRRAKLTRQVRIVGWSGTDGIVTKVKLMCRVPEIDRAAVTALFDDIAIEWFAELPNGLIREVRGWDASSESWLTTETEPWT